MVISRRFAVVARASSLALSVLFYTVTWFIVDSIVRKNGLGFMERIQIVGTVSGMIAAAFVLHVSRNLVAQSASLLVQFLAGLFLGVVSGPDVWIKVLWIMPLTIQLGIVMNIMTFIPFTFIVLYTNFKPAAGTVIWGRSLPDAVGRDRLVSLIISAGAILVVGAGRWLFDRLMHQDFLVENLKTNLLKLTQANYDFQKYAADTEETTLKRERLRISREIHDTVGYTMTTLRMMLEAGTDLISESPLKLELQLRKALDLVNQGHEDIRLALTELRERESIRPRGLKGLKKLIDLFSETTGVAVRTEWGDLPWNFPDAVEGVLYRFVQEGMSNALSHGNATSIDIHFRLEEDDIIVNIADDGIGADVLIEGLGLHGMRERVESCGGRLETRSTGGGFLLQAQIPMLEERAIYN
ncbi:MAG: sensor histidine kinase [Spirochaetaceae bacterium]|nr:sensor histidine kinase [Spirochaetaceae bacterium]